MRRGFLILALGFMAAAIAYCCFYLAGTAMPRQWLQSAQPELAWLGHEFKLTDAEFDRIARLHAAYMPRCKDRCRRIEELNAQFTNLVASATQMTPEIEKILAERAHVRAECQAEMLKHFFEVSRTMPPEQGKRYLAWVRDQTCLRGQTMDHGKVNQTEVGALNHRE